jgi:hypothetical protein
MSVGTNGEAKNMSRLAQGRKTPFVDPVSVATRMEKSTRDDARSLNLPVAEILRTALEEAVEVAMRELNYQHPEEIPQVEHSSWLGFFKWW